MIITFIPALILSCVGQLLIQAVSSEISRMAIPHGNCFACLDSRFEPGRCGCGENIFFEGVDWKGLVGMDDKPVAQLCVYQMGKSFF